MHRLIPGAAAALLIAAGGLTGAALGNDVAQLKLAQATAEGVKELDAEKVKQLDAEAERLYEAGKYAEATALAERALQWREVSWGLSTPILPKASQPWRHSTSSRVSMPRLTPLSNVL